MSKRDREYVGLGVVFVGVGVLVLVTTSVIAGVLMVLGGLLTTGTALGRGGGVRR